VREGGGEVKGRVMTVILRNPFRAGARRSEVAARRANFGGSRAGGWQTEGRAFDDVIICSNARALPGLIIRCLSSRSAFSSFLLLALLADNNHPRPYVTPFDG